MARVHKNIMRNLKVNLSLCTKGLLELRPKDNPGNRKAIEKSRLKSTFPVAKLSRTGLRWYFVILRVRPGQRVRYAINLTTCILTVRTVERRLRAEMWRAVAGRVVTPAGCIPQHPAVGDRMRRVRALASLSLSRRGCRTLSQLQFFFPAPTAEHPPPKILFLGRHSSSPL